MAFEIKRGYKDRLMDKDGSPKIDLQDGCWYLTLDTAEVYVAINLNGVLDLYKINEAPGLDLEEFNERFDALEARVSALENKGEPLRFAEKNQFPSVGESDKLYIAIDENQLYIFMDNEYVPIGGSSSGDLNIQVINGGDAKD
jgi:hypothetical protein